MRLVQRLLQISLSVVMGMGFLSHPLHAVEPDRSCGAKADVYQIGLGKADITGALSGRSMLGYADPLQRSQGLHMRLWSRALYLKEVCSHTKSVMVIADLGLIFANLKDEVLKKLDHRYPGVFHSGDVMISATHTHSSGGGYSAHALYNITTLGFDQNALEGTADGIAQSIVKAYETSFLGGIEFHKGELKGAQFNRSIEAYLQNPKAERDLYGSDVDREMQMLVLKDEQGRARGSWNWFPVHGVSLSAKNRLLSGDNKGLAAYQLERVNSRDGIDFIAGFVQSHSGDVSPYEMDDQTEDFLRNEQSAAKQYLKAEELLESPGKRLSGPLQGILKTFDLRNRILSRAPDDKGPLRKTCEGTLGVTFAAGTENGRGLTIFHEGTVYGRDWPRWTLIPEEQDCQAEKVILLPTGLMKPYAWTANVAPFQILRIGSLAVVAVPFEMTTMAGMRLKKTMLAALKDQGIEDVVISALANDYLHYVTTREEYAAQAYEGGSNLFGPWSLDAYLDILDQLAHELGRPAGDSLQPIDERPAKPFALPSLPSFDWPGLNAKFGDLKDNPKAQYNKGDLVSISFVGGELNDGSEESLITIQKENGGVGSEEWFTLYRDEGPQTTVSMKRQWDLSTVVEVKWRIAADEKASRYRICHQGSSQFLWQSRTPYKACSPVFSIRP